MTATATATPAPTFFRTPNAGQITRTLKAAGFTQATRNGVDGFRTERGTLSVGGARAEYVIVKLTSGHVVKALRDILPVDGAAFDAEHAARVLCERGYDARVTTDGRGNKAVAVWSESAREARAAFERRAADAGAIAGEWITEGLWRLETDSFPEHSRAVRTGDAASVRAVVAHVLRSPGSYRDMAPRWFPGICDAAVVLWVELPDFRGTMRITPAE